MLIAPRSRSVPQGYVHVPPPNPQIKAFSNLDKVLSDEFILEVGDMETPKIPDFFFKFINILNTVET